MRRHIFTLGALGLRERAVIERLRMAGVPDERSAEHSFSDLHREAHADGQPIAAAGTRTISESEIRILAWLTLFQRQRRECPITASRRLRPFLAACAARLEAEGCHLSYQNVARAGGLTQFLADVASGAPRHEGDEEWSTDERMVRGVLQARALRFVRTHQTAATSELKSIGVSRQMASEMCRRGLLRRVRMGLYTSGHPTVAPSRSGSGVGSVD